MKIILWFYEDGHEWRWSWEEKEHHHQFLFTGSTGHRLAIFFFFERKGQIKVSSEPFNINFIWPSPVVIRVKNQHSSKFFPLHLQPVVLSHSRDAAPLGQHNSQSERVWFCISSSNQSFLTQWILWPHWAWWRASQQFSRPQPLTCQNHGKANTPLKGIST